MRIGAHLPTRGRLVSVAEFARQTGAEAVQFFISNPRAWAGRHPREDDAREFRDRMRAEGLGPVFVHSTYLVNVASPNPEFLAKSVAAAQADLDAAEAVGAAGLIVHAGAGGSTERAVALERAAESFRTLLDHAGDTEVLIELTAGGAGSVASTLGEAAELFAALDGAPAALCLDTCHLFAAGYALDRPDGVEACFGELAALDLAERLRLLHANDARFPRGSRRDRHEHVGHGHIGEDGFRAILGHPVVRELSVCIETPGRLEDHAANIATLRRLAP